MLVLRSPSDYEGGPSAVTIGNFDGVHRGHQEILRRLREESGARSGARKLVLTFQPHPAMLVRPESAPLRLTTAEQKAELLEGEGADVLLLHPFNETLARMEPDEFAAVILAGELGAVVVVVGENFRFGRDRKGDRSRLESLGGTHGFDVVSVPPLERNGRVISSSRIREAVASGWIEEANEMLGRPHTLVGVCVPGASRGRSLGFPTANLKPENELIPAHGVYVTESEVGGQWHPSVTNIGTRPTFRESGLSIESHILDFQGDLRERRMRLRLHRRLREEQAFDSPETLAAQIARDVEDTRSWFRSIAAESQPG